MTNEPVVVAPARASFLRSVAGTYGAQLLLLPLSLGASILQARLVGPDGRGQISLITTTVGVAVLYLGFGLPASLTYHLAGNKVQARSLLRPLSMLLVGLILGMAAVLAVIASSGLAPLVVGVIPLRFSMPVLLALFTLTTLNSWMGAILSARRDFGFTNTVSVCIVLVPLTSYGAALRVGIPVAPATFAICVLLVAEVVRGIALGARVARSEPPAEGTRVALAIPLRAMISYSLLAYACDAVQFLTYRFDVWLVRHYRGDAELGHYSLAVTLGELVWLLAGAVASVLFPHVPTMSRARGVHLTARMSALTFAATAGISLVGFALAVPLIPVLFSEAFRPSVPLLGLLLVGMVPYAVAKILGNFIAGIGAMRLSLISAVVGMVVCVGLDLIFIPRFGATAAAAATSIAYVVFTLTLLSLFLRHEEMSFGSFVRKALRSLPPAQREDGP